MASALETYKLSFAEHEMTYNRIRTAIFEGVHSARLPQSIILGGQPGCGKTALIQQIMKIRFYAEESNDVCIINGDEIRRYHPHAKEIYREHEKQYAEYTDYDVRKWTEHLLEEAIEQRFSIIFECTMRTQGVIEIVKRMHQKGYRITILPMAVNRLLSMYAICDRYITAKEANHPARFTRFSIHDAAYRAMPGTLQRIFEEGCYADIDIWGRNATISASPVQLHYAGSPVDTVIGYRKTLFQPIEAAKLHSMYSELLKRIRFLQDDALWRDVAAYYFRFSLGRDHY